MLGLEVRDRAFDLAAENVLPLDRYAEPDTSLPRGCVLGTVRLDGIYTTTAAMRQPDMTPLELSLGDYSAGRYAWLLGAPKPFREPIPARGALGLWEWEPS